MQTRHSPIPTTVVTIELSQSSLGPPVHGGADVLQRVIQPRQTFRVSNQQVTSRLQNALQLPDHFPLGSLVEIDHHVPAEDKRVRSAIRQRLHQVEPPEVNLGAPLWF